MTKCYYCGKPDGSHDISCICGKTTPTAMNAASPTNQCGTCDGNGVVGSPPDQYFNCPECAAMHDCPDCEGSGRISPAELCQLCNESGILPDQGSATTDAEQLQAHRAGFDRKMADPLHRVLAERASSSTRGEGCEYNSREAAVLRRLLAWRVSGGLLYADDGELQDITAWPHIDFKRDTVDAIETKLGERSRAALAAKAEQSNTPVPCVGGNTNGNAVAWWDRAVGGFYLSEASIPKSAVERGGIVALYATPVAERAAATDDVSAYKAWLAKLHPCVTNIDPFYAFKAGRAAAPASVLEGYKLVPVDPAEEMIRAACLNQCTEKYASYEEWWDSHTSGISARIRDIIASDYRAMISAAPEVAQPAAQGERAGEKSFLIKRMLHWEGVYDLRTSLPTATVAERGAPSDDLEARNKVAAALGLPTNGLSGGKPVSFAWSYLLGVIKDLATPAPTAGERSAEPDKLCNSTLRAEPAGIDLALRADFDAFLASTQGIVTGEKWPSIEVKKAWMVWQACADALATRSRAEGGMQDDTPISMSTYGSLAECEAERERRAIKATQGGKEQG